MIENHYAALEVPPTASHDQVKAGLLAGLARVSTREQFDRLWAANRVLTHPTRRAIHDAELAAPPELRPELEALEEGLEQNLASCAARFGNLARAHPYPALLRAAGLLLFQTEQYNKACRVLQRLCDLEPQNSLALTTLAEAHKFEGRRAKAAALLEHALELDPGEPLACVPAAHKLLFEVQDFNGAVAVLERGLTTSTRSATSRLPLLTTLLVPLAVRHDTKRLEETVEQIMELFPRAKIAVQQHAITAIQATSRIFPPEIAPVQARFFHQVLHRLVAYLERFRAPDPQAEALQEERARLEVDPAVPDWIGALAKNRELLPVEHPIHLSEESPAERLAAAFQAWVRVQDKHAEWGGFETRYPVLARRIPMVFCLGCCEAGAGEHTCR